MTEGKFKRAEEMNTEIEELKTFHLRSRVTSGDNNREVYVYPPEQVAGAILTLLKK